MVTNNFDVLIKLVKKSVDKKKLKKQVIKDAGPVFNEFNRHIINWLKEKKYPLRKGQLTTAAATRVDPWYGETPTQRIHATEPLAEQQLKPNITQLKSGTVRIRWLNKAPHAELFFEEVRRHWIPSSEGHFLIFTWGAPLPWKNLDDYPPGLRKKKLIDHPGHMRYADIIDMIFHKQYIDMVNDGVSKSTRNAVSNTFREVFK